MGAPSRNRANRKNADTRLDHNEFLKQNPNRQIAIRGLGGGGLNGMIGFHKPVSEGDMAGNIQELRDLMSRATIDRKDPPSGCRIPKRLIYGENRMPETQN